MSQESEAQGAASWRRRHPALSRSLLYGAGLLVLTLVGWALVERGKLDRQDRLDYFAARLDALDVLAAQDPTGNAMEEVLDEVFADSDLPPALRSRALRARSILHLKRDEAEAAIADLDAAAGLTAEAWDQQAIGLERAQALIEAGRVQEAEAALAGMEPPAHPALVIWRAQLEARVLTEQDRPEEATRTLDDALEALHRPLPDVGAVRFSLTPWTPAEAALHATKELADLATTPRGAKPWTRLLRLAPRDLLVAVEVAKALQRRGDELEADRAWAWAVALNGGQPPKNAASNPDLAALEKKRVEGLKTDGADGR